MISTPGKGRYAVYSITRGRDIALVELNDTLTQAEGRARSLYDRREQVDGFMIDLNSGEIYQ